jgi:DNA-binding transcriptional LysR family regulator
MACSTSISPQQLARHGGWIEGENSGMLHSRLLKYLDEVARLGSIRKAAARLNVASSAINRQILALESEIGAPIFERIPRRLRLTATGEVLIAHVRDTLKAHQRVEAQIEAFKGLTRGEVTIATMNGLATGPLPRFLSGILDQHSRVLLRLRVLPFDQMTNAVLTGDADMALTYNPPNSPDCASSPATIWPLARSSRPSIRSPSAGRCGCRIVSSFRWRSPMPR